MAVFASGVGTIDLPFGFIAPGDKATSVPAARGAAGPRLGSGVRHHRGESALPDEVEKSSDVTPGPAREPSTPPPMDKTGDRDTGAALRSVYQKTVDETVPYEMLDLLGKLR